MASLKITHATGEVTDYPLSTLTTITIDDGVEKYVFSADGVKDISYSSEDVAQPADDEAAAAAAAAAAQAESDAAAQAAEEVSETPIAPAAEPPPTA